jgi:hypothetical protein
LPSSRAGTKRNPPDGNALRPLGYTRPYDKRDGVALLYYYNMLPVTMLNKARIFPCTPQPQGMEEL